MLISQFPITSRVLKPPAIGNFPKFPQFPSLFCFFCREIHLFVLLEWGILRRFLWSAPTFVCNGIYSKICTISLGAKMGSKDGRQEVALYAHIIPFGFCLTLKRDFISAVDNCSSEKVYTVMPVLSGCLWDFFQHAPPRDTRWKSSCVSPSEVTFKKSLKSDLQQQFSEHLQ
jgi:hypothetical protein